MAGGSLIVQKFGGTSVGSIERIQHVAKLALDCRDRGDQVVLVTSAMSGETNRLVGLARQLNPEPYSREYDMLVASGEQVAVGLLALAINTEARRRGLGQGARGLLAHQIGIKTDNVYSRARIREIDTTLLRKEISRGVIPVIAGFQGVDPENNITTLGRGGSDTSAVAIAVAIGADDCEIYTDVDGVYTTDPKLCRDARKISKISYEEMMELSHLGAKVLQIRSVELAAKYKVPLHVRSSFEAMEGTRVVAREALGEMEQVLVIGIASTPDQVKFTLQNIPNRPGMMAKIFGELSEAGIVVDVIVENILSNGTASVSFTVNRPDFGPAIEALERLRSRELNGVEITHEKNLAKVGIVGVGMAHHPGVASKMFKLLAEAGINIRLVTTSEIKVSCMIDGDDMKRAVECLHRGFELQNVD